MLGFLSLLSLRWDVSTLSEPKTDILVRFFTNKSWGSVYSPKSHPWSTSSRLHRQISLFHHRGGVRARKVTIDPWKVFCGSGIHTWSGDRARGVCVILTPPQTIWVYLWKLLIQILSICSAPRGRKRGSTTAWSVYRVEIRTPLLTRVLQVLTLLWFIRGFSSWVVPPQKGPHIMLPYPAFSNHLRLREEVITPGKPLCGLEAEDSNASENPGSIYTSMGEERAV